jgi:hypothetical protein
MELILSTDITGTKHLGTTSEHTVFESEVVGTILALNMSVAAHSVSLWVVVRRED